MLFERLGVENTPQNQCFEPKLNFLKAVNLENQSQNQKANIQNRSAGGVRSLGVFPAREYLSFTPTYPISRIEPPHQTEGVNRVNNGTQRGGLLIWQ